MKISKILPIVIIFLFVSENLFSQGWVQQSSGTSFISMYDVKMMNPNTVFVAGYYPDGYGWVYKTTNAGTNWNVSYQTQNPLTQLEAISFSSASTGIAVGGGIFGNGSFIIRTTNGGTNWVTQSSGANFYNLAVHMVNDNTGYICGYEGSIFKTTDGGTNWLQQTSGTTRRLQAVFFINATTGVIAGDTGTVLRTTDGGTNWGLQSSNTLSTLYDVYMCDNFVVMAVGANGTIIKSVNGGITWALLNSGVSVDLKALSYRYLNICTIIGASGTVLRTTNQGFNWIQQNSTITQGLMGVSFADTNNGTAVGDNGKIIRTTNGGVTYVSTISNEIPGKFSLSQNYPNPFNPTTKIRFALPKNSLANLVVYDVLGRELTTLVNENLNSGTYEIEWDAMNYSSGVYYYKLIAGDYVETKRMVLLK